MKTYEPKTEEIEAPVKEKAKLKHTPYAGCLIGAIILSVLLFVGAFSVWKLFQMDGEIGKFASAEQDELALIPLLGNEALVAQIEEKLAKLQHEADNGRMAEAEFSAEELNLAIAHYEPLKAYRKTLFVEEIGVEQMRIRIAFPLGSRPLSKEKRFLNGLMLARPELAEVDEEAEKQINQELVLRVDELQTDAKKVPEGFLGHFSPLRVTEVFFTDEDALKFLRTLDKVRLKEGAVVLSVKPIETSEVDLSPYRKRTFLVFGIIAMCFVSVIVLGLIFQKKSTPIA